MVTIKDIAKEADVSHNTVSVVLGERKIMGRVSEETRTRIKDIATRMGYSRNAVATNMRHGSTKIIVFVANEISQEYTSRVLEGASEAADKNQFFLKLIIVKNNESFKVSIERLLEQRPSGLITRGLSATQVDLLSSMAKSHDIPVAYVENYYEYYGAVNVYSDDTAGMESMVEYLHSLGHRRIAHISNGLDLGFAARRYQGFCHGMKQFGLANENALFFEGIYDKKPEKFYTFIKKILNTMPLPTAVCTCSDYQALAAINIIQSLGKRIPEDISITGYGDLRFCQNSFPTLTTVKQPFEKMGMAAADNLIKAIQRDQFESIIQVPTQLVIRNSSSRAAHK